MLLSSLPQIKQYKSVEPYFYNLLHEEMVSKNIKLQEYSEVYLLSVLKDFHKQSNIIFYNDQENRWPTLFSLYNKVLFDGTNSFNDYRNLGDIALFIVGLYPEYIKVRTNNSQEYYFDMGAGAYFKASKSTYNRLYSSALYELAIKFESIVELFRGVKTQMK